MNSKPDYIALAALHKAAIRLRPRTSVAIGGEGAAITLAQAISTNKVGELYFVCFERTASERLLRRMLPDLRAVTQAWVSPGRGLPPVVPDLLYVGSGGWQSANEGGRSEAVAIALHYEGQMTADSIIFADVASKAFAAALPRHWRKRWSLAGDHAEFVRRQ